MELSKFTGNAVKALSGAQEAARSFGHTFVGSEHLLMGVISCADRTAEILKRSGVTAEAASPYIDTVVGGGRNIFTDSFGNTQTAKRVLELALYEAKSMGKDLIDTDHIILSIMRERDSVGARIIDALCRDKNTLREALLIQEQDDEDPDTDGNFAIPEPILYDAEPRRELRDRRNSRSSTPVLDAYTTDLTELARRDGIDPVIGRDAEIARVILTLCRRTKNNPVLIGEPGVGKTAIAEGLAKRIAEGNVPPALDGTRVLSFDLAAMLAGTRYRGEFEERLKAAVEELSSDDGTVLFIDEIHTLVGAGASEGSVDAANIMKPALARGELRVIGATTVDEYRAHIEKDPALERRFTPILVSEPTVECSIGILKGLRPRYEQHHGVSISDEAIEAAAELSVRFITDRYLPDKAIDLMDEACAGARLLGFGNAGSETLRKQKEIAAESGDFELAERLLEQERSGLLRDGERRIVGFEDVARAVSERTGLDICAVTKGEWLKDLEERLCESVYGHNNAVSEISALLRRSAAGLKDQCKVFASFVLYGPAGIGKKTLVGRLADEAFKGSYVRLNGSELSDDTAVMRLIGAPAGYKDAEKGGVLTEFVRLKPVSVISLCEPELCSRKVVDLFTQILSDGTVRDGKGRLISFRNCVIAIIADTGDTRRVGFSSLNDDNTPSSALPGVPSSLLSLADSVIGVNKLDNDALESIAMRALNELSSRALRKDIVLTFGGDTASGIVSLCGGSPAQIKRLIALGPEAALSEAILNGTIARGDKAVCLTINGKYSIRKDE